MVKGIPSKRYQILLRITAVALVLGSTLINIKNIFTSCQVDAEYQVAMAYRILRGDRMFSQMWEAHQTSAFFLAFFEWFFLKMTGSTTGIVVYANTVGVLCKTAVAFCVYGTFRKFADKRSAFAVLLLTLNAYPKEIVLPDFANQQIWFGLLLMCCLIWYFEHQKIKWLVLGAVCLCLQVLSYPSCVLVWIMCVVLIWMYSSKKGRDICIFTGVCGIGAASYLGYFMRGNPRQFMQYIYYIWSGDEAHAVGLGGRLVALWHDMPMLVSDLKYILIVAVCAVLAAWICRIIDRRREWTGRKMFYMVFCWFMALYILGYLIYLPAEKALTKQHFYILYVFVSAAGWKGIKNLDQREKRIFMIGQFVGFGGFVATLLLSDMGVFSAFAYMIPSTCAAIVSVSKLREEEETDRAGWKCYLPAALLCAVLIFRNGIYLNGWTAGPDNFYEDSIFSVDWTAKYGPLKGIISRAGTYVADVSYQEWQNLIQDGDRVMVIGHPTITATVYLNKDVEICTDSVISTPTYSERLFTYWEENPDKNPNVVVLKCYEGSAMTGEYNSVIQWLMEEVPVKRIVDGVFWRYYFLE